MAVGLQTEINGAIPAGLSVSFAMKSMNSRFSLLNLFFAMAFFAALLCAYNFQRKFLVSQAEIQALQRELDESRPISFWSVRRQIKVATQEFASTEVTEVHYNSLRDRYSVQFGWRDSKTNQLIGTGIPFEPDGNGKYVGLLLSEPFAKVSVRSDGSRICEPLVITIKDDVARVNDILKQEGMAPFLNDNWRTKP